MGNSPLFTVIMDTYNRPALLKEAVGALFRQTHENLEIVLVNNGATPETIEFLYEVEARDNRVKLVHFEENQYRADDPARVGDVCYNAGLTVATGDYVWFQADDDLIAEDYAEKMVALFQENSDCTTAAGITKAIDIEGNFTKSAPRSSNFRPRYMPGHLMVLDSLRGETTLYDAQATIFTVRRDVLVDAGGFHRSGEYATLYGIVPFGVTGFDDTAIFYWRRHEGQLGSHLANRGWLAIDETFGMLKEWHIEQRWRAFGADVAREAVSGVERQTCSTAASWFVRHLYSLNIGACFRIVRSTWRHRQFWLKVATYASEKRYWAQPIGWLMIAPLKRGLQVWPGLANLSSMFARLRGGSGRKSA